MAWFDGSISTERLRLRRFRDDDRPTIERRLTDPDVRRYLGGPVADEVIAAIRSSVVGERWGVFCIADAVSDEPLGGCSFDRERDELELSYDLLPEHWGRGCAIEGLAAAVAWAWSTLGDASMIAVTQVANAPSLRLLGRLGFVEELRFEEFGETQALLRLARPASGPI